MNTITDIKQRITFYEKKYNRDPGSVTLLAVSKNQPVAKIIAAHQDGQHHFGESYAQEALPKIAECGNLDLIWHFIGPIQSNKTRKIAENFAWVHSVSSIKIAKRLNEQRPSDLPPLNICIEVNISQETNKAGVASAQVLALAQFCETQPNLRLRGLMAIPGEHDNLNAQRCEFHKLRCLQQELSKQQVMLDTLSMGMSGDFEAAIAEGATIVRIGTAIFGDRMNIIP